MTESKWSGNGRHLNWLKLMVDPDGGFYFDEPAKDGICWAIQIIEGIEEKEAGIRREARQRCLDELEAFSNGEEIEGGVGTDVKRVYLLLLQRHEKREGFTPA